MPYTPRTIHFRQFAPVEALRVPPQSLPASRSPLSPSKTSSFLSQPAAAVIRSFILLPSNVTLGACNAVLCSRAPQAASACIHMSPTALASPAPSPTWYRPVPAWESLETSVGRRQPRKETAASGAQSTLRLSCMPQTALLPTSWRDTLFNSHNDTHAVVVPLLHLEAWHG